MTPAEIAELRERLGNALRGLEMRRVGVTQLEQRNVQIESAVSSSTNLLKEVIVLKKQLAEHPPLYVRSPKRRGR